VNRPAFHAELAQQRNGRTTPPDTAIARSKAIAPFLAYEELGDDRPLID
jgi:hypothetical protein